MNNIIEVSNLVKKYNNKKVVDNLSFNVKRGSLFSFLGSNGAGKTTTISILTTLLRKDSGNIYIDGIHLDIDNDSIRKKIGIVFQGSILDDLLTVYENLMIRGSIYFCNEELKEKVSSVVKLLKLDNYINQRYGTLSGGEKRRVDIARSLIHEPSILFLDEPTTGLDPSSRQLVWDIIKELQKEKNITVFLTTHYMEEANDSDIVGIIEKGKLIAFDSPYNLKNIYASDVVKIKINDIKNIKYIKEKYELKDNLLIIKVRNSIEGIDLAYKYKEYIENIEIIKGSMDDVFLNITGTRIKVGN